MRNIFILIALISGFWSCEKVNLPDKKKFYNADIIFRGANTTLASHTKLEKEDVKRSSSWGINLVRINFNKDDLLNVFSDSPKSRNVWKPYEANKERLEMWLRWLGGYGIVAMISLDRIYGDDHESDVKWQ